MAPNDVGSRGGRSMTGGLLTPNFGMVSAHKPLIVPMLLRISQLRLRAILTLALDAQKGVTLSFKNDPLESVRVNSTFDDVPNVRTMLQTEIQRAVSKLLSDALPDMIHRMSLNYLGLTEESIEETLNYKERSRSSTTLATSQDLESSFENSMFNRYFAC